MKKIIEFFKNWFEKNGLIKVLAAFLLLILSVVIGRNTESFLVLKICNITAIVSSCYLVLTVLIFTIAGIVNSVRDIFKKKQ